MTEDQARDKAGLALHKALFDGVPGPDRDVSDVRALAEVAIDAYLAALPAPDVEQVERVAEAIYDSMPEKQPHDKHGRGHWFTDLEYRWQRSWLTAARAALAASSPPSSPDGLTEEEIRVLLEPARQHAQTAGAGDIETLVSARSKLRALLPTSQENQR